MLNHFNDWFSYWDVVPHTYYLSVLKEQLHKSSHCHPCNLSWAKLKTQLGKHSAVCQLSNKWYTRAEEKLSVRVRQQQQIRGLLHYYLPRGLLPQSSGTWLKGQDLDFYFFPNMLTWYTVLGWSLVTAWHNIPHNTVQRHQFSSIKKQHPDVWPSSPIQPSFNFPLEAPVGRTLIQWDTVNS